MKDAITAAITAAFARAGVADPEISLDVASPGRGEYTTNAALRLSKQAGKAPKTLALEVKNTLEAWKKETSHEAHGHILHQSGQTIARESCGICKLQDIEGIDVADPGFLNLHFSESSLSNQIAKVLKDKQGYGTRQKNGVHDGPKTAGADVRSSGGLPGGESNKEKGVRTSKIMVEFAHPNTHKAFHIGHLRNITTGEAVVRLLESDGVSVIRANYQGDVGMHIAKCLYGIHLDQSDRDKPRWQDMANEPVSQRVAYLGRMYALASALFEEKTPEGDRAREAIMSINKKIYAKDPSVMPLYEETRRWSLEYFDAIYRRVGTHFDRLYFESETFATGLAYVRDGLAKGVFEESDGAVIFPGEKHGLHNRVFITKDGNATYEGKDVGLARLQMDEYHPDRILHIVGPEQSEYFKVLFAALERLFPDLKGKEAHLPYGWVRLKDGKMSSRLGNVVTGEWLIGEVKKEVKNILETSESKDTEVDKESVAETAAIAAIKYAFLKVGIGQEIAFDLKESVNMNGDSGPYLLYTYARARSILRKAGENRPRGEYTVQMNPEERALARLIALYPDIRERASATLTPSSLAGFLFDLAQSFNLFYHKHPVIGSATDEMWRLDLTEATAQILANGLGILGIPTVERM